MILSICIPVYNFDVIDLVNAISDQIVSGQLDAEIILIDDASTKNFVEKNMLLESKVNRFIFLPENIGRSKIRNLFLKYTQSDYLLFLDCDGKVSSPHFIQNYLDFINAKHPDVIYGGRKVEELKPGREYGLRWKFAVERENLNVEERIKFPYLHFQTNNFVVKKTVLEAHPFDESITQYGYEDLIFARDLFKSGVKIDHIENPIVNDDVETNHVFLDKADQSARSLAQLIRAKSLDKNSEIKLAKAYFSLKDSHLLFIFRTLYNVMKPVVVRALLSGYAPLRLLDFYKLGQMAGYIRKN